MRDYAKLGLKAGLEIHQQLDTKKLFIRTQSNLCEESDFNINRKLRPVASELGEYDKTALDAFKRNETFIYSGKKENISLVELDEEPPQPLEKEALKTVIEVASLCNSTIISELQPMRKTVIDGSNTSAFQRTMMVALGGELEIKTENETKKIGIETIVLEEDACRPIKKENNKIYYNLDRLGIPLIELATAPDIKTPKEAVLTAKKIGEIMRLTGRTKRGKGTIRQDVNVSIAKGNRVEIKGCQDLELIETVVEKEIERQIDLLEYKDELNKLFKTEKEREQLMCEIKEISEIFEKTECKFIKGKKVFGFKLNNMKGMLGRKIGEKRFASELSDYIKSIGVTGLLHLDELPNYGITEEEVNKIKKDLICKEKDNFIIIVTEEKKAKEAYEVIKNRFFVAFESVPKETRGATETGGSTYQRPLSSAARMYPETDILTCEVDEKYIDEIKNNLPKSIIEREKYYEKLGLSKNHIDEMKLNNFARFFEELVDKKCNPIVSATLLLQTLTELKRNNVNADLIKKEEIEELLVLESKDKINKNNLKDALVELVKGKTIDEIIKEEEKKNNVDLKEIKPIIDKFIQKNKSVIELKKLNAIGSLMNFAMQDEKLKQIDKKILSDILRKEIEKVI
ncbi:MAG: Glu-tRNA(Gln) amidotransferase subunit GatE [Candidatus ainarchaeum sp.]|nr:Glu-tRNA(Gln) amidotransferase subunit GatE [Candidatus ainarchaeum sp.]